MSRGGVKRRPSFVPELVWTKTRRLCCGVASPRMIWASVTAPELYDVTSTMRPVLSSTTGAGLPRVSPRPAATTDSGPQVQPPSVERRRTTSMLPLSPAPLCLPSAKARRVPLRVLTVAGMR